MVSEKLIEDDLSRVERSATRATKKIGLDFERSEDKREKSAPKFVPSSNYHKEEKHSNLPKLSTYQILSHPSTPRKL